MFNKIRVRRFFKSFEMPILYKLRHDGCPFHSHQLKASERLKVCRKSITHYLPASDRPYTYINPEGVVCL
jgi:hypothetical protein